MSVTDEDNFHKSSKNWAIHSADPNKGHVSIANFIFHVLHEGFIGNVPIEVLEKFPGNWVFCTAFVTYAIFVCCYVGFFVWPFLEGQHQTFISLDSTAGNCQSVQKPLSGTYLASSAGVWAGNADFKFTDAVYEFQFNEFHSATRGFADLITTDFALDDIGNYTATHDIATNLLVWMLYRKTVVTDDQKVQAMKFYSSPSDVFQRVTMQSGIYMQSSPAAINCAARYTTFDASSAQVSLTFPPTPACQAALTIFGPLIQFDGASLHATVHLNGLSTAAAINNNIISINQLEVLTTVDTVHVGNYTLVVNAMYDPAYQRSNMFLCSSFDGAFKTFDNHTQMCFVDANGVTLLPILTHADEHCTSCDDNATQALIPCNYMGLLPFYLYFPALAADHTLQTTAFFHLLMTTSVTDIRRAVARKFLHNNASLFDTICPGCAFIWVFMADQFPTVSPYKRLLPHGLHCVDSVSSTNFAALAQHPPTVLVEKYYVCRNTLLNNLLNAVGISFGNTSIFAVTFLAVFLPLLFYFVKKSDTQKKLVNKYVGSSTCSGFTRRTSSPHTTTGGFSCNTSFDYGSRSPPRVHKHITLTRGPHSNESYYGHFGDSLRSENLNTSINFQDPHSVGTGWLADDAHMSTGLDDTREGVYQGEEHKQELYTANSMI